MQIVSTAPYITPAERQELLQKNDLRALLGILYHWAWIVVAFYMIYTWWHPITIFAAIWIIGAKQLACAILMHDASHHAVLKNNKANDLVGSWLGGYPIFQDILKYRGYHHKHHISNGLEEDPDLLLTRGYPTSPQSMMRKCARDLFGITGIKAFVGIHLMKLGYVEYNLGNKIVRKDQSKRTWSQFLKTVFTEYYGPVLSNGIIFTLILLTTGSGWYYLLWVVAYLTTFQVCLRVRSIAEHSVVEDREDPYQNTRTTKANILESFLFAPYFVNYHAEHHMLMGVPSYHLPRMHQILKERGYFEKGVIASGYWEVIKKAGQVA